MTGEDLVHQLWTAAGARGLTLEAFVAPLATDTRKFLRHLRIARFPTRLTIARVGALIEGRAIPPARSDNGRKGDAAIARAIIEQRIELGERAALERLPGETLHAAARRLTANHEHKQEGTAA